MNDDKPTPLSNQMAAEVDVIEHPKSWHVPIKALQDADTKHDSRLAALESGFARLEQKTDAQTVMLGEIKGAIVGAATNPKVRVVLTLLFMAFTAWMAKHGFKLEMSP